MFDSATNERVAGKATLGAARGAGKAARGAGKVLKGGAKSPAARRAARRAARGAGRRAVRSSALDLRRSLVEVRVLRPLGLRARRTARSLGEVARGALGGVARRLSGAGTRAAHPEEGRPGPAHRKKRPRHDRFWRRFCPRQHRTAEQKSEG
jgi:hypothetical protein